MRLLTGDAYTRLSDIESESVQCCITSPPYWGLRDYGVDGQIGLEKTPDEYVNRLVRIFNRVKWALRKDGVLWVVIGDSYSGSGKGGNPDGGKQATNKGSQTIGCLYGTGRTAREAAVTNVSRSFCSEGGIRTKQLIGIPWRLAFALQSAGWYLRQDVIWAKPNPMPESVRDRCTRSHEYIFMFSRSPRYYYDNQFILEESVSGHGSGNGYARSSRLSYQDSDGQARGSVQPWTAQTKNSFKRTNSKRGVAHVGQSMGTHRANREDISYDGLTRNRRDVWTIPVKPYLEAHFATFPEEIVRLCLLASSKPDSLVLDPFSGSGTTAKVCKDHGRDFVGIELNSSYHELAVKRLGKRWWDANHTLKGVDWETKQRWRT